MGRVCPVSIGFRDEGSGKVEAEGCRFHDGSNALSFDQGTFLTESSATSGFVITILAEDAEMACSGG